MAHDPIVILPARMASTRLPGKMLADIHGTPLIVHSWRRAAEAGVGQVFVACDSEEIKHAVEAAGGHAVLTDPNHPSGSDRVYEALQIIDPAGKHDVIINLQGDMPTLDPKIVHDVLKPLQQEEFSIATLATEIRREDEKNNPAVVKAVLSFGQTLRVAKALYFTRATAPTGNGPLYHHIGVYAYRRKALEAFVKLPPSTLEQREKLEQLRALENNLSIGAYLVDTVPLGVDTAPQLEEARELLK